ncbi:hypothetical protein PR048_002224 [Dryococelus australis]|uniref:Uncharacterized protein n=1 Tax=Dryococelus australis TaxID=614101 RepID=A0ABQ9IJK7_9NEOP|nr:hypothetical protein PR048_002224 [Dryococelus australis]
MILASPLGRNNWCHVGSVSDLTGAERMKVFCGRAEDVTRPLQNRRPCSMRASQRQGGVSVWPEILSLVGRMGLHGTSPTTGGKGEAMVASNLAKPTGEGGAETIRRGKTSNRTMGDMWEGVKDALEDNYAVRKTLDFNTCKMFNARQGKDEQVVWWSSKLNSMVLELKKAAVKVLEPD